MSDATLKPSQRFTVNHLDEADFKTGGLRNYSAYRDLGIAAATNGLAQAHVIHMVKPFSSEMSQRHHHNVEFQLVYSLKGWFSTEFEGHGVQTIKEGSSVGSNRRASGTPCAIGRMIASYSRLSFRQNTKQSMTLKGGFSETLGSMSF